MLNAFSYKSINSGGPVWYYSKFSSTYFDRKCQIHSGAQKLTKTYNFLKQVKTSACSLISAPLVIRVSHTSWNTSAQERQRSCGQPYLHILQGFQWLQVKRIRSWKRKCTVATRRGSKVKNNSNEMESASAMRDHPWNKGTIFQVVW